MKKVLFVLAALALAATACNKETEQAPDYSNVQVKLAVTMPGTVTKSNFSLTNASNPVGGMDVTWQEGDNLTLIVFQGDNASWESNFVYQEIALPAAAEGLTTYDVSSLGTSLDLSSFDPSKNLKYVVVLSRNGFNDSWKEFSIWNGMPYLDYKSGMSTQINVNGMIAETDVKEVPFSNPLVLSGSLHWITSVLAVQFTIDPAADITYEKDAKLIMDISGSKYVDCYKPITKVSSDAYCTITNRNINFDSAAGKLSEALDANYCRYFTIPADDMTGDAAQKLGGSTIKFRKYYLSSNTDYTTTGSIDAGVTIESGKVYGIRIHVTDSDSDGNPEFTKM